jgi:hypothetical protein
LTSGSGVRGADDVVGPADAPALVALPIEAGPAVGAGDIVGRGRIVAGAGVARGGIVAGAETLTIPKVSPLRGSKPQGTMTITIGGSIRRRASPPQAGARYAALPEPSPADLPPPIDLPPPGSQDLPPQPPPVDRPATLDVSEPLDVLDPFPTPTMVSPDGDDEPPLPDDVATAMATAAAASTIPVEAGPDQTLHIRFANAPDERIVAAFTELRTLIRSRPGATPVVLHIPAGPGRSREMRLGIGIAYDADLLAEVSRTFGSLLRLNLA